MKNKKDHAIHLKIDTSSSDSTIVEIYSHVLRDVRIEKSVHSYSQILLPALYDLLHSHQLLISDIAAIHVSPGPGSYMGLRVGHTVAKTLSYLYDIPLYSGNTQIPVKIIYSNDHFS
jgi:tRNA threonylcarbamoyladenosine biosynthesis protein TsaB